MSRPVIIGFICQKGGVGRTTASLLLANYLTYQKGKKVSVVDTDTYQYSIYNLREQDDILLKNPQIQEIFSAQPYPIQYPVQRCDIGEVINFINNQIISFEDDYDYIIVDTKGSLDRQSLHQFAAFDVLFIPTEVGLLSVHAANKTASIFSQIMEKASGINLKSINLYWSRYRNTPKTPKEIQRHLKFDFGDELAQHFLKSSLPDCVELRRRAFNSTILFPLDDVKVNPLVESFLIEVESIIEKIFKEINA